MKAVDTFTIGSCDHVQKLEDAEKKVWLLIQGEMFAF